MEGRFKVEVPYLNATGCRAAVTELLFRLNCQLLGCHFSKPANISQPRALSYAHGCPGQTSVQTMSGARCCCCRNWGFLTALRLATCRQQKLCKGKLCSQEWSNLYNKQKCHELHETRGWQQRLVSAASGLLIILDVHEFRHFTITLWQQDVVVIIFVIPNRDGNLQHTQTISSMLQCVSAGWYW